MDKILHTLVSTYCIYKDNNLTFDSDKTDLSLVFGYSLEELEKKFKNQFIWMILPEDRPLLLTALNEHASDDEIIEVTLHVRHKNGRVVLTMNKLRRMVTEDNTECFYGVMMDISNFQQSQIDTNNAVEQYRVILSQTKNVTFEWDVDTDTITFSDSWDDFFHYQPSTKNFAATLPANPHIHPADIPTLLRHLNSLKTGTSYQSMDIRLSTGGQFSWFCLRATGIFDSQNRLRKIIGILLDINDEKKESSALLDRAERDSLTKLLNKATSKTQTIEYLSCYPNGAYCALMVIDLDNFKHVNDTYGHMFGDTVLLKAAEAIKNSFRSRDLVARIGGDEFMVLMKDISNQELVKERCQKMLDSFQTLLEDEKVDHHISCSIGVALSPHHGTTFEELFKCADEAMYQAKNQGKNNFAVYNKNVYYY